MCVCICVFNHTLTPSRIVCCRLTTMADKICYSNKYYDDTHEYRLVGHREREDVYTHTHTRHAATSASLPPFSFTNWLSAPSPCLVCCFRAFSHVFLPKELVSKVPHDRLMSETEWRNIGVQQSRGWIHYMIHRPGSCAC